MNTFKVIETLDCLWVCHVFYVFKLKARRRFLSKVIRNFIIGLLDTVNKIISHFYTSWFRVVFSWELHVSLFSLSYNTFDFVLCFLLEVRVFKKHLSKIDWRGVFFLWDFICSLCIFPGKSSCTLSNVIFLGLLLIGWVRFSK